MRSPSDESGSEVSEDEYEVEYILGARWDGTGWEYEVHWYMYDSDNDTWEPEKHLTNHGSAGLVDRFWKKWPKKRHSRPVIGTQYRADPELLIEERKRFLANRPKDRPVKGIDRPKKEDQRITLIGDSESGEDEDVLEETEDDEDILHSSSSDDIPLKSVARSKPTRTGSSTGSGIRNSRNISTGTTKQTASVKKFVASRPAVSRPTASPLVTSSTRSYSSPAVKVTKIAKEPIVPSRRGRKFPREEMHAGSISKDFTGIGTKGKQAERAGEVMALGRRGSGLAGPAPTVGKAPGTYAGLSMRKTGQVLAGDTSNVTTGAGPSGRVGSGTPVDSPTEMSPTGNIAGQELPMVQEIDELVRNVQEGIEPDPQSPRDSLFDDPGHEEVQDVPQMDIDIDIGQFSNDVPLPVSEPPILQAQHSKPARPIVSTDVFSPRAFLDGLALPHLPSPDVQNRALPSPMSTIRPLQPGQWYWKGDLFITIPEPMSVDDGTGNSKTKSVHHRAGEIVIRDPAIPNEKETKIFTTTLESYVKGKITIQNMFDLYTAYAEIGAGAFEPTQAAWMVHTEVENEVDLELWRGIVRKMEMSMLATIVKIHRPSGEMVRHLLLVPCKLIRKFRRLKSFLSIVQHFQHHSEGFVVIMCKRVHNTTQQNPRPFLATKLPEHWQRIPPELHGELRGVKCLVFPEPSIEPESRLLISELSRCEAIALEGHDSRGQAGAVFIHRAWVGQLSRLLGLTDRRKRLSRRFYAYGSGGLWGVSEWSMREIWLIGGMVTFTPAALSEDPWIVDRVINAMQDNVTWSAYIEPSTIGVLALRKNDDDLSFALDKLLDDIAFSNDFAQSPLALTSPPQRGLFEELKWIEVQHARAEMTGEQLRRSCEEEVLDIYAREMEAKSEKGDTMPNINAKEASARKGGNADVEWGSDMGGWGGGNGGGWGNTNGGGDTWGHLNGGNSSLGQTGSGDLGGWGSTSRDSALGGWGQTPNPTNGWTSPTPNPSTWGIPSNPPDTLPRSETGPTLVPAPVDLSQVGSEKRIQEISDAVIEGLKTMQIQPCFMREVRRFIVIDSAARVRNVRPEKIEVEVVTSDQFIADFIKSA